MSTVLPTAIAQACHPASYRQLDYWVRVGYLHPSGGGSGNARHWPATELAIAALMATLVSCGFTVALAATVAREHYSTEQDHLVLSTDPYIAIEIHTPEET